MTASLAPGRLAFTCVIPVCAADDAHHFDEALAGIADSTLPPTELLIAEDGDLPPPLAARVKAQAGAGARHVRNPGPRGLHHNLNHAFGQVRTPWIARADADDINLPHRFALQARFLRENPEISVLGGGIIEFFPDDRRREKRMPMTHDAIVSYAAWRNPINHMTAFIRAEAFADCGGYPDLPMKEDYGLWLEMIARGHVLANLEAPLVLARLGENFHHRRSGGRNLASEVGLCRIKRRIPRIGSIRAWTAMAARAALLSAPAPAAFAYERVLRR